MDEQSLSVPAADRATPPTPGEESIVYGAESTLQLRRGKPKIHVPSSMTGNRTKAEFLVDVPRVVLLLDGDDVADIGWPDFPMPVRRKALVDNLSTLCTNTSAAAQVVFDGNVSERCPYSKKNRSVEVRLCNAPARPAKALHELVTHHAPDRPLVVVSDNSELCEMTSGRAEQIGTEQLLDVFLSRSDR